MTEEATHAALAPVQPEDRVADCVVVGAGIIGLATALRLREQGRQVLLIERSAVAAQASRGNAGACAYADILPLASPGIIRQAPRWLLDPLGPLSIPPRYLPTIAPWLWRFWRASRPQQVLASTQAQVALMGLARQAMPWLVQAAGVPQMLRTDGNLQLYGSRAEWQASLPGWAVRAEHGIQFEHLMNPQTVARWQPGISPDFPCATWVPGWQRIDDPLLLCQAVAQAFVASGGAIRQGQVMALEPNLEGVSLMLQGGQRLQAQQVVVAAGAWSHHIAKTLGHEIPLETERGYNTTLPSHAFDLKCQLTFGAHGFVVTPIGAGVRVGGAVEMAGLTAAPNYRRAHALLAHAKRFLPGLRTEGGTPWMGLRPSLPDSLPVIGTAPGQSRVFYAFGHGHLGLTQSAATAQIISNLCAGQAPPLDLHAFSAARF